MGLIAGKIGYAPSEKVVLEKSFRNATGGSSALYLQAQRNLDQAQQDLRGLVTKHDAAQSKFDTWVGNYEDWYNRIKAGDYNDAILKFVTAEKYGHGKGTTWLSNPATGENIGDLHYKLENTAKIIPNEWDDPYDRWSIHGMGVAGNNPWNAAQRELVTHFANITYAPGKIALKKIADDLASTILDKQKEIDRLTVTRDKALAAEEKASGQRIKEKQSDPEYLKAKAEADRIVLEAGIRQKRNRNLFILGLATIGLIGLVATIRKK